MRADTSYSAHALLRAARDILAQPTTVSAGVWPRAAAHLCRQALESGLAAYWSKRMPGVETLPLRAQLLCLPSCFDDPQLSRTISYTWAALSNACHHHVYELAPTAAEIGGWIDTVEAMLEGLAESSVMRVGS
jgi:hypothetical protein